MKKIYVSPSIKDMLLDSEEVMQAESLKVVTDPDEQITNSGSILSREAGPSLWDEEEE